ncbi:hypothetical protein PG999_001841 [Apiospora kogelbergensis]|uniref:Ysc84 actin-binding domain-containing protein n=1 Tax=Apiospora kogelbergensis TaxID=1337665 RepID=A0AAW0R6P7_9PEZI
MAKLLEFARAGSGRNSPQHSPDFTDQKPKSPPGEQQQTYTDSEHGYTIPLPREEMPTTASTTDDGKGDIFIEHVDDDDYSYGCKEDLERRQYHLPQQTPASPTTSICTDDHDIMMQGHGAPPSDEDSVAQRPKRSDEYGFPGNKEEEELQITSLPAPRPPVASTPIPSLEQQLRQPEALLSPPLVSTRTLPHPSTIAERRPKSPLRMHPVLPRTLDHQADSTQYLKLPRLKRLRAVRGRSPTPTSMSNAQGLGNNQETLPGNPDLSYSSLAVSPIPSKGRLKITPGEDSFQQQRYGARLGGTLTMDKECAKARKILQGFTGSEEARPVTSRSSKSTVQIPAAVLQQAHGLVIYTTIRAGLNVSGSVGSGVVLARLPSSSSSPSPDGAGGGSGGSSTRSRFDWSGPSAFSVYGAGASLIGGFDVSESVCVLNSDEAVRAFYSGTMSQGGAGGGLAVAAGPPANNGGSSTDMVIDGSRGGQSMTQVCGDEANAPAPPLPPPMWIYTKTRGLYIGGSVDGTVFNEKREVNESFYDEPGITPDRILTGQVRSEFRGAAGAVLSGIATLGFGPLGV